MVDMMLYVVRSVACSVSALLVLWENRVASRPRWSRIASSRLLKQRWGDRMYLGRQWHHLHSIFNAYEYSRGVALHHDAFSDSGNELSTKEAALSIRWGAQGPCQSERHHIIFFWPTHLPWTELHLCQRSYRWSQEASIRASTVGDDPWCQGPEHSTGRWWWCQA